MNNVKKDEFINLHQNYLNDYIKFADGKALAILSINAFVLKFNFSKLNLNLNNTEMFFHFIAYILLIFTIIMSAFVIYPRTNNKSSEGIIFWDNISRMKEKEFINKF
ncbi:hypothetical protein [Staphylococcus aureus]